MARNSPVPSLAAHRKQRGLNASLAEKLLADAQEQEDDCLAAWAVVVAFYSALHHVETLLRPTRSRATRWNHEVRNRAVQSELPGISGHYLALYTSGREARYGCPAQFPPTHAESVIRTHLPAVLDQG